MLAETKWRESYWGRDMEVLPSNASDVGLVIASLRISHSHSLMDSAPELCLSGLPCFALFRVTEGLRSGPAAQESRLVGGIQSLIPSRHSLSCPFRYERTCLNFLSSFM